MNTDDCDPLHQGRDFRQATFTLSVPDFVDGIVDV